MSDIALINGDIQASSFGYILIVNDDDDIIQMAVNNIMTIYGSNEFHPTIGNKVYNERHKMSERGLLNIANECKNAILQDSRVNSVIEIIARNASTPTNIGLCDISFIIQTTSGKQLSSSIAITIY
jgi:hypothetical protein